MFLTDNCDSCRAPEELVTNFHLRLRNARENGVARESGVKEGGRGGGRKGTVGLMKSRLCVISDVYAFAAPLYDTVKLPVQKLHVGLVTLSARVVTPIRGAHVRLVRTISLSRARN